MKSLLISILLVMLVITLTPGTSTADAPSKLNYQGLLTDGTGQPVTGQKSIKFSLYTVLTGGTAFWTETQNVTLDSNGRFSVTLGSSTALNKDQFTGTTYLGIKVGTDAELAPRQQLTSVAYALQTAAGVPTGGIIMWSGTVADIPAGWALCDGSNGTPNLRDKFIVGAGSGYAVGATGGEVAHILTVNEMPSHNHTITDGAGSHNHGGATGGFGVGKNGSNNSASGSDKTAATSTEHNHSISGDGGHNHTINPTGGGVAFENRPPYYALAYIMKL